MPWDIRKTGEKFCIYKQGTDEQVACHETREKAEAQLAGLYASEEKAGKHAHAMMLSMGGEVKALPGGRVAGYLITFTNPDLPDLSQYHDFFTPDTDYGVEWEEENGVKTAPVYFDHGMNPKIGKRRLTSGTLKMDEVGVWIEGIIKERDEWEKAVGYLARKKKLGWSSGAPTHLVDREPVKRGGETIAHRVTIWPIAEASLTPFPAEPVNDVYAIKSLADWQPLPLDEALEVSPRSAGTGASAALTLAQHSEAVVSASEEYAARLESRLEARVKAGRMLSQANVQELEAVLSALDGMAAIRDRIVGLLEKARPVETETETPQDPIGAALAETGRLRTDTLRQQSRLLADRVGLAPAGATT